MSIEKVASIIIIGEGGASESIPFIATEENIINAIRMYEKQGFTDYLIKVHYAEIKTIIDPKKSDNVIFLHSKKDGGSK